MCHVTSQPPACRKGSVSRGLGKHGSNVLLVGGRGGAGGGTILVAVVTMGIVGNSAHPSLGEG